MPIRGRVDRIRCVGAGNCVWVAPTAFDWHQGDYAKADLIDSTSVEEEQLREAAFACPTAAIVIEEVAEFLPWQLRDRIAPQRVQKTFMFTDIVRSTNLVEALGDEAWQDLLRWHDQTLRGLFGAHHGQEATVTGDGFFVGFDSPEDALGCAVAIQRTLEQHRKEHGFAPQVRIGVHASQATQVGSNFTGKGVHEAARLGALAGGGEIVASADTVSGTRFAANERRTVTMKGLIEPIEIVSVDWR